MKNIVFDIPNGPANLKSLFPDADWNNVEGYSVTIFSENGNIMFVTSNEISCCCTEDKIRIHFVNSLGRIDAINFHLPEETLETKSDSWQKSLGYPLVKSDGGTKRINIKSNENYKAINSCYKEEDMEWIKELFTTPKAWVEWRGTEGQPDDYIPINITDKKIVTRKNEGRYYYDVVIEFSMSNENIHLRN